MTVISALVDNFPFYEKFSTEFYAIIRKVHHIIFVLLANTIHDFQIIFHVIRNI